MALSRTPPSPGGTGWFPVARAADVGSTPRLVGAGGRPWVVVRLRPGAEVTALSPRCPHRLLPLTSATVVGGELRCAGHGWTFATDGRCRDVPALGPDAVAPPRADLTAPWAVEERDGWVWVAPERTLHHRPPRAVPGTAAEPVPALPAPAGPVLDNLEPALARAWHPVARADQLEEGGWLSVQLLGRTRTLQRRGGVVTAEPPTPVRERDGALWLAPEEPCGTDLPAELLPGRTQWLPAIRTGTPAAVLLDAVLDPGAPGVVPLVTPVAGGATARWTDAGRQVVVHLRAPFQLRRDETLPDGATRSLLLLLQPEDADSTLVHARVALGGRPGRAQLAAEAERVGAWLSALDRPLPGVGAGLPLTPREEVHLPTDRLGVAYRHALADLLVTARPAAEQHTTEQHTTEEDDDVAAA